MLDGRDGTSGTIRRGKFGTSFGVMVGGGRSFTPIPAGVQPPWLWVIVPRLGRTART